jgi:polygalacturonase
MVRINLAAALPIWVAVSAAPFLGEPYPDFNEPTVPVTATVCDVTQPPYSAQGDGVTLDTKAIQSAIYGCSRDKDAHFEVILPKGKRFLTGALNLTSWIVLRIEGVLLGSTDPSDYPVVPALPGYGICRDSAATTTPSHHFFRHQALLSGWNLTDATVTGSGMGSIDGQALIKDTTLKSSWVDRFENGNACQKDKKSPLCKNQLDYGRPRIWEPMFSQRLQLREITVTNQAFWAVHPYGSDDIYIGAVNVTAPRDEGIPNDDGIDPDSCSNVLVEKCFVSVGDNSVAIKSGMNWYVQRLGTRVISRVHLTRAYCYPSDLQTLMCMSSAPHLPLPPLPTCPGTAANSASLRATKSTVTRPSLVRPSRSAAR